MLIGAAVIIITVAVVLLCYFGMRHIMPDNPDDRTKDLSGSVLFRISALHGLVLALVFASEVVEYQQLGLEIATEVNAVSDVYYDAARYGEAADGIQSIMQEYLKVVQADEWQQLGTNGDLSGQAWAQWDAGYQLILDLPAATPRHESLRENMLRKIHLIAQNRDLREHHAKSSLNVLFWVAALIGVLLVAAAYYTFTASRSNVILISMYAAYTGFILFTIYAMSNPFVAPAAFEPVLFKELLTELAD